MDTVLRNPVYRGRRRHLDPSRYRPNVLAPFTSIPVTWIRQDMMILTFAHPEILHAHGNGDVTQLLGGSGFPSRALEPILLQEKRKQNNIEKSIAST